MNTRILNELRKVEESYCIDILYACESGSRAWGFPSPDSDYDVRFIYKRKTYLTVLPAKEQLSFPISANLDMYGWDVRKVLQLLYKSNCTPFEWLQSPVLYKSNPWLQEEMSKLFPVYFNARKQLFHYLGIAKGAMQAVNGHKIGVKKLFYVLRPLFAAMWIEEKKCYPPMSVNPLLAIVPPSIKVLVEELIMEKAMQKEADEIILTNELQNFISSSIERLTLLAATLPQPKIDSNYLDKFFIACVTK